MIMIIIAVAVLDEARGDHGPLVPPVPDQACHIYICVYT